MQHVIDISGSTIPNSMGSPTIVFYKENEWSAAGLLTRGPDNHEMHFGCYLRSHRGGMLSVDTVEHARKIIEALEVAIEEGWLFTAKQIEDHADKATATRAYLARKIKADTYERSV